MPPSAVKTVRQLIYWQYAKIVSESAGAGKKNYGMIMSTYKKLCDGQMNWSTPVREWKKELTQGNLCIYCGAVTELTTEHILPKICGGADITDNVVRVCKGCNSTKGGKRLYEWRGLEAKDEHHRIAEGKYLKYLYALHEKNGTLDMSVLDLCPNCDLPALCAAEGHQDEMTVYCLEGCFHK